MNYCIIMPQLVRDADASYMFPIGMAYVSSALKATGRHVLTYNLNYKQGSTQELIGQLLREHNIDVLASGGLTGQYPELREIFEAAKLAKPDVITWVGGGIITASPVPAMEALEYADYGMVGEGEITISEQAEAMEGKRELSSVDGLIYRDGEDGKWTLTRPRKEIEDLDVLPFPDYEGFEYDQCLAKANFEFNSEHGGLVSFSRSCPFHCTFCFHPSGTKYRKRSLESILQEVDFLIEHYHIKSLFISDELFSLRKAELGQFCDAMRARGLIYTISLRVDMVSREMLERLKESGCQLVCFGLESADNTILKSMNKHITVEQINQALRMCLELGLPVQGNFIFGDEAETVETYRNTLKWWRAHPEYNIKLGAIFVYPGSILYQNACRRGLITDEVAFIRQGCPQLNVSKLSDDEYRQMLLEISTAVHRGRDPLKDGQITYSEAGLANAKGRCPHCGHENIWINREIFRSVTAMTCVSCNRIIDTYLPDYIDTGLFLQQFQKIRGHKAALWGMISSVEALYQAVPDAWKEDFFLVDSAPQKQGLELHGKVIQSPDVIARENVGLVIITFTSSVSATIYRTIMENYPSVKKILFLGDFLDPNLDL